VGTLETPTTFWHRPWGGRALVGSSASGFVFVLYNDKREDEGRQGVTHAPCRDAGPPTPTTRWRTPAASVVRRHGNTTESARQRTAEAPLGADTPASTQGLLSSNGHASSAAVWRRLKAFSQHGAWSRQPSRRKLTVSSSHPRHHSELLVLLQTGPRHQARGPMREHQRQAGERPPFSTLRARPYEHTFPPLRRGWKPAPAAAGGGRPELGG